MTQDPKIWKKWENEFPAFESCEPVEPPRGLSDRIHTLIQADLNPKAWSVFSKIALIHVFVGMFSLLLCPQFGLSWLGNSGLMGMMMQFGDTACMLTCGSVFVGTTVFVSSFLLRPEEIRVFRKTELLQIGVLGLLSLGAFLCLGEGVVMSLGAIWFMGALIGGVATLELGWWIRGRLAG